MSLSNFTIDANVFIAWLLPDRSSVASDFLSQLSVQDRIFSNHILLPECTTVLRTEVFFRRLRQEIAVQLLDRLLAFPFALIDSPDQFKRALVLARQFQHKKAYDMQYLAVAELTRSELVTMDRGLRHAAQQIGVPVTFLR